jgi:hypothetical protein
MENERDYVTLCKNRSRILTLADFIPIEEKSNFKEMIRRLNITTN